jgi:hypothetical protein
MSGNVTTSANDLIQGAALNINAFAPGQQMSSTIASTCMQVLNDLLDSLSTDQAFVYTQTENIVQWTPGQYQYTIGNPVAGTFLGFTSTLTGMTNLIVGVTNLATIGPTFTYGYNNADAFVGGTLTDVNSAIPANTTIVSYSVGAITAVTFSGAPTGTSATVSGWAGGLQYGLMTFSDGETRTCSITALGAATWTPALTGTPTAGSNSFNSASITMSGSATSAATTAETITYTTPGNFAFPRPLRFRTGFTRITTGNAAGLDYRFEFVSLDRYNEIGYKGVPGPWPYLAALQPTFPLATLWVYPQPSLAGTVFLYTDLILTEFTNLTQSVNLPQGYNRALKKLLALELCPIFGKTPSPQLILQAKESKEFLKNLNASPVITLRYDSDLIYSRHTDASFITDGGFR